ncbi:hypothetical protein Egran_03272 [Elaphomyces granulatus]|uniref:Cytochrome oxidase c assembly-domain-containing protein n=1 Tax=Elaphomyces granulatus TaxID=519963 RepID=A0A232LXR9_9EURO|nr:hypothetical protein Egran_03272 [Elaphomyces granulatus]
MSRSAADATRFTATGPYASSKAAGLGLPLSTPYRLPGFQPKQPSTRKQETETPRQKVERLRAQARAARLAQSTSRVDRIIEGGRKWANQAHKVMIYSLIAASGVCGILTIYSIASLTMYNRRQRNLWLDRQLEELQKARLAYANGTATAEQLDILRNEKIGEIEKRAKHEAKEQRLWNRTKKYLFPTTTTATVTTHDEEDAPPAAAMEFHAIDKPDNMKRMESASPGSNPTSSLQPLGHAGQQQQQQNVTDAAATKPSGRSWKSWITGQ